MTISTQKTMLVVAAAIAGVLLTLGTQAVLIGLRPTPAESVPARSNAALVEKDQEIARLRSLLAAQREAAEPEQRTADNPSDRSAGAHPKARAARSGAAGSDPRAYLQLGEEWRKAILQASDLVKRQETWDLVRSHVASAEGNELLAALWAVRFTSHVDLDRAGLASLLTSHIESRDPGTRLLAWQAVIAMERATHGEGFALDPARSGALRREVAASLVNTRTEFLALLIKQSGYRVEGETSDVVLRLLDQDADPSETLRGLGTARHLSPEVEKRIMEIARSDPDLAAGVNRWITRGIEKKSRALVEFLLDGVEADMPGALAALSEGVLAEDAALVGDRLHRLFDSRENPNFQSRVVAAIGHAGDEASREWLLRLREREDVDPGVKFSATVAIRALDRKKQ